MILLIDNYDSFTWNLAHYLGELGADVVVRRNDAVTAEEALAMDPAAIVLSPGPCDPDRAGVCLDLVAQAAGRAPILGVCLGHQTIGQAFGGRVERCREVLHGKLSALSHCGEGLFRGLPQGMKVTRYHSLDVARDGLPACLAVTAESESGVIMGLAHRTLPIHGVQFHPESIASEHGRALLKNFLDLAEAA
ncbi:MAG: aminodeoxychorismate/anthranilate synthase component II [Rhodobacteraceae bacterium]|nr:MAG: aminodeoxychorismate/anthranilate synthase component II [Paracoccaceae bacterium]